MNHAYAAEPSHATRGHAIRPAEAGDVDGLVQLFNVAYADSSHPCKHAEFVRSTIGSPGFLWRVADRGGYIAACSAVVEHAWNRTWEIGRGVTHPEYRGAGIGAELCQQCVTAACEAATCDLVHGFPRNATIARIAAQTQPALLPTGHDGGINVANGVREYHGVIFARNPKARLRHFSPPRANPGQAGFVQCAIFDALGLTPEPGAYPERWIAGPGTAPSHGHPFSVEHDPRCRSASLEVTGYFGSARTPGEMAAELLYSLERFPEIAHARLAVLADKTALIERLTRHGFEAVAYLPAWYWLDGGRFDCVLMARRRSRGEPAAYGLSVVVDRFREGLASC